MALTDIKARISAVLAGVAGIGTVFTRMRPVNIESVELAQFVSNGVLNCCFISRSAVELESHGDMPSMTSEWDAISVHEFFAVQDSSASEDKFDTLVTAMLWAIHNDSEFPGYFNHTAKMTRTPRVKAIDFRHFGVEQTLCHHAEITIQVMTQSS
jgi:hypothetical protein